MQYLLVGAGGTLGSIVRFKLGAYINTKSQGRFPWSTFIINITGAFLLGIVSTANVNKNVTLFLGDGFLGAYTTFSTFMYEGFNLFQHKKKLNAFIYILSSIILGVIGFILGSIFIKFII